MNIAITAGLQLMPPGFAAGLGAWGQANGLSGEATWANAPNAAIVPADQDFGACLEIVKQADVTRIRFTGETPILPGTYLRVSARVKGIAGNLPQVTEIAPLLIVIKLEQFDYAGAAAIGVVMLAFSFILLLFINLVQRWSRRHEEN